MGGALVLAVLAAGAGQARALGLGGQRATCAGPGHKQFSYTIEDNSLVKLSPAVSLYAYTFNGQLPGPIAEVCEGDQVTLRVANHGNMEHGLDTHALRVSSEHFGPIQPGETRIIEGRAERPGVYMLHCAAGPMTDMHIKMGMYTEMIVYPRRPLRPAREVAVIEGAAFGDINDGQIVADQRRLVQSQPTLVFFNGALEHPPVYVRPGERVRVYFLNTAPGVAAVHVIGDLIDRAYASGNPHNLERDVQTFGVEDGNGAIIDFTIPEAGTYLLVDHDRLSQLKNGLALRFVAQ